MTQDNDLDYGRSEGSRVPDTKRLLDITFAAAGLIFASPILGAIAIAVRLDSSGPALFKQDRVGKNGKIFQIHKFRTMRGGMVGPQISSADDPRITRVGAALRHTKLDELPQLWDVLRGTMSFVGPRPEVPKYVAMWSALDRNIILSVRPGITDPASIEMRNEGDDLATASDPEKYYVHVLLPRKTELYADYVRTRSNVGDLMILARTVRSIFEG